MCLPWTSRTARRTAWRTLQLSRLHQRLHQSKHEGAALLLMPTSDIPRVALPALPSQRWIRLQQHNLQSIHRVLSCAVCPAWVLQPVKLCSLPPGASQPPLSLSASGRSVRCRPAGSSSRLASKRRNAATLAKEARLQLRVAAGPAGGRLFDGSLTS